MVFTRDAGERWNGSQGSEWRCMAYEEGNFTAFSTCANFAQVADNGKTYKYKFYSLAAIIAVGYRIDSERAYKWLIEGDVSVKGESPH